MRLGVGVHLEHFALDATLQPGEIERQIECCCELLDETVIECPVHECAPLSAINAVVPEFDATQIHTLLDQCQQASDAVLARNTDYNVVIAVQIHCRGIEIGALGQYRRLRLEPEQGELLTQCRDNYLVVKLVWRLTWLLGLAST